MMTTDQSPFSPTASYLNFKWMRTEQSCEHASHKYLQRYTNGRYGYIGLLVSKTSLVDCLLRIVMIYERSTDDGQHYMER